MVFKLCCLEAYGCMRGLASIDLSQSILEELNSVLPLFYIWVLL